MFVESSKRQSGHRDWISGRKAFATSRLDGAWFLSSLMRGQMMVGPSQPDFTNGFETPVIVPQNGLAGDVWSSALHPSQSYS